MRDRIVNGLGWALVALIAAALLWSQVALQRSSTRHEPAGGVTERPTPRPVSPMACENRPARTLCASQH